MLAPPKRSLQQGMTARQMHVRRRQPAVALGRYPSFGPTPARKLAADALADLVSGVGPKERQQAKRLVEARQRANTFEGLAREFLARRTGAIRTGVAIAQTIERDLMRRWGRYCWRRSAVATSSAWSRTW